MKSYLSKIDSERFGFNIAKINDIKVLEKEMFIQTVKEEGFKLIFSRIPSEEIGALNFLESIGFRIMDIQSTYVFELDKNEIKPLNINSDIKIRDACEDDIFELSNISKESFEGYGHYFADKGLDKRKCREIYKDWTVRSILDINVADRVFVAEINSEIAGFLSFKIFKENNIKYAAGGLGAVSKIFRGKNVFNKLAHEGLNWGKEVGLKWEEHNVLNINYPVNRVFSKLDFTIRKSHITLHKWID